LAAGALSWTIAVWPSFRADLRLEKATERILDGERFTNTQMQGLAVELLSAGPSNRVGTAATAVLRLRVIENQIVGSPGLNSQGLVEANDAVSFALGQNPSDSFLWLAKFWLENLAGGTADRALTFLRMSYQLGPNEGWIATHRNSTALDAFSKLPPELAQRVVSEFVELVRSGFYSDAAIILSGPGRLAREKLLPRLAELKEQDRRKLARELELRGVDGAQIPGVAQTPTRPF